MKNVCGKGTYLIENVSALLSPGQQARFRRLDKSSIKPLFSSCLGRNLPCRACHVRAGEAGEGEGAAGEIAREVDTIEM